MSRKSGFEKTTTTIHNNVSLRNFFFFKLPVAGSKVAGASFFFFVTMTEGMVLSMKFPQIALLVAISPFKQICKVII